MTLRRLSCWMSGFVLALAVLLSGGPANCQTRPGVIHGVTRPVPAPAPGIHPDIAVPAPSSDSAVVAIFYKQADDQTYICTGILITNQLVLTAGHCGCGLANSYWIDTRQNVFASNPQPGQRLLISSAPILFDQRVCRSGMLANGNDLALIRLQEPIKIDRNRSFPPAKVFTLRRQIAKGSALTAVGYGYTESHSIGVRNEGEIPVYSLDCEERRLSGICGPFSEMILAGGPPNRPANDTCGGDSGGPVYRIGSGGTRQLVAITSRAMPGVQQDPALHCGGGGIYTLVGRKSVYRWLSANGVNVPESLLTN